MVVALQEVVVIGAARVCYPTRTSVATVSRSQTSIQRDTYLGELSGNWETCL